MANTKLADILLGYEDDGRRGNGGEPLLPVRSIAAISLVRQVLVDLEGDGIADPDEDPWFVDNYAVVLDVSFPSEDRVMLHTDHGAWSFLQGWELPVCIPGVTEG